jgi:hypothetical protein
MKMTYQGSCHCGAVRYEADLDLSDGTVKCNCSICMKERSWLAALKPEAFRLLAGQSELTEYQFGSKRIHHLFCRRCGVRSFGWGQGAEPSDTFYVVNVNCLDDVEEYDLLHAPVVYVNGRHDDFS